MFDRFQEGEITVVKTDRAEHPRQSRASLAVFLLLPLYRHTC